MHLVVQCDQKHALVPALAEGVSPPMVCYWCVQAMQRVDDLIWTRLNAMQEEIDALKAKEEVPVDESTS